MNKDFPTCRTCKWYDTSLEIVKYYYCEDLGVPEGYFVPPNPDQFFCSEHQTTDGTRFVTWPKE